MEAITAAQTAYAEVVALGPTASSVRAMRRAGDLFATLVRTFERFPAPLEVRRDPELDATFQSVLAEQIAPMREQAARAYDACVERARVLGVTGRDVDAAGEALAAIRGAAAAP
jgi:hypothetical protein